MVNILSFGKRKLIEMNYSQLITLPKDWLRTNGIEPGNTLELLLQEDGSLRIQKG